MIRLYVSMDPRGNVAVFPAYIASTGKGVLDVQILGNGQHMFAIDACAVRHLAIANDDVLPQPEKMEEAFFVTDGNWNRGIARHWAGFFTCNTPASVATFRPGRHVRFANGETRQILRNVQNGIYLEVYVTGRTLVAGSVGLPSGFKVITPAKAGTSGGMP